MTTEELLEQRGKIYGKFSSQVYCISSIVKAMKECAEENDVFADDLLIAEWHYLAIKLARIASCPLYIDSYKDLSAYSKLIMDHKVLYENYIDTNTEIFEGKGEKCY